MIILSVARAAKRFGNLEVVGLSQRFDDIVDDSSTSDADDDDNSVSSASSVEDKTESDDGDNDVGQVQVLLDYYTMLNWGGRRLLLVEQDGSSLSIPLSVWPFVFERASQQDGIDCAANVLFYLLRWGPVLWAK